MGDTYTSEFTGKEIDAAISAAFGSDYKLSMIHFLGILDKNNPNDTKISEGDKTSEIKLNDTVIYVTDYDCVIYDDDTYIFYDKEWRILGSSQIDVIQQQIDDIKNDIADIKYIPINIESFSNSVGICEKGTIINTVKLSWTINKTPKDLTIDGESVNVGENNKEISGLSITWNTNKTWTLRATDDRDATDTATTKITFYNGVYYGAATDADTYDSAFILGLTKELRSNKKPSFSVNAGEGQYIYYCLPTSYGTCTFTVGGFTGGFNLVDTVTFTNASGYTENYYIYKSDKPSLGSTDVIVK